MQALRRYSVSLLAILCLCHCGTASNDSKKPSAGSQQPAQTQKPGTTTEPATGNTTEPGTGTTTNPTNPTTPVDSTAPGTETTKPAPAVCPQSTAVCTANPGDLDTEPGQCDECLRCDQKPARTVAGCAKIIGTQQPCQSHCHVPDGVQVAYCSDPPTSGDHDQQPERKCGEHATPVSRGKYVHSEEHGAVVITYNCPNNSCPTELALLRKVVEARTGKKVLLTADPLQKSSKFAAASWTWLYNFETPDEASLLCFIDQHVDNGREDIPLCQ